MRFLLFLVLATIAACGAPSAGPRVPVAVAKEHDATANVTRSPWSVQPDREEPCGVADAALERVATKVAAARDLVDIDELTMLLRLEGSPYVRPRLVRASAEKLGELRTSTSRCGIAKLADDRVVAIVVDALADLDDVPMRGRTGQWLTFAATSRHHLTDAKVFVLGPRGLPRTVPVAVHEGAVRARFALDRPGAFTVQLVADVEPNGPQPLLEARVFADVDPSPNDDSVPGEEQGEDAGALERMTNALRTAEALAPLTRRRDLDAIAQAHAEAMMAQGTLAHRILDGGGDARDRLEAAGISANATVGENVARATSVIRAHRALHASPSHRANLLGRSFSAIGIGIARTDRALYVCEVFL